jgi:hypothetical protein
MKTAPHKHTEEGGVDESVEGEEPHARRSYHFAHDGGGGGKSVITIHVY